MHLQSFTCQASRLGVTFITFVNKEIRGISKSLSTVGTHVSESITRLPRPLSKVTEEYK